MIPIVSRGDAEKTERKMSQGKNSYHDIRHQAHNESPSAIVQIGFDRFTDERLGWSKKPFSFLNHESQGSIIEKQSLVTKSSVKHERDAIIGCEKG